MQPSRPTAPDRDTHASICASGQRAGESGNRGSINSETFRDLEQVLESNPACNLHRPPDEARAIEEAIKLFNIPEAQRSRLIAQPVE